MDKILVVDDEPDILNLAKIRLEKKGYLTIVASDGEEALQKAEVEMPDFILLDVVLPGKSGFEVCKILKSKNKTKFIPIVMFTSLGRDVDKKMTFESGADGHFIKPFTAEELLAEIKKHLDKARPLRFSKQLGIEHSELKGKKSIFEFDPSTPYERIVRDFVLECVSNKERTIVMTRKGSTIQNAIEGDEGIKRVLSPETMISPILNEYPEGSLSIVYDSLTDLTLSVGSQVAYNFARNSLELLSDPRITALFLLNPAAHETIEVSRLEGIFSDQIIYGKQGITSVRIA